MAPKASKEERNEPAPYPDTETMRELAHLAIDSLSAENLKIAYVALQIPVEQEARDRRKNRPS